MTQVVYGNIDVNGRYRDKSRDWEELSIEKDEQLFGASRRSKVLGASFDPALLEDSLLAYVVRAT